MRKKNRNVSYENPFDKSNRPPQDQNSYVFTDKPTKTNPKEFDISNIPLAGRLSEVG